MARSDEVTELLYKIDRDITPVIMTITVPENAAVSEAYAMGLIFLSGYKYLLSKDGIILVKSGLTYDDFLRERLKKPSLIKDETQSQIITKQHIPTVKRNFHISLSQCAEILTVLTALVTIWFTLIKPIIDNWLK